MVWKTIALTSTYQSVTKTIPAMVRVAVVARSELMNNATSDAIRHGCEVVDS